MLLPGDPFTIMETLMPAWISNYIHYEVRDEITYYLFQTSSAAPLSLEMDK